MTSEPLRLPCPWWVWRSGGGDLSSLQCLPSRQSSDLCPHSSPTSPQTSLSLCGPGAALTAAYGSGNCWLESWPEGSLCLPPPRPPPYPHPHPPSPGILTLLLYPSLSVRSRALRARWGGQKTQREPGTALWVGPWLIIKQTELLTSSLQRQPGRLEPDGNPPWAGRRTAEPWRGNTEAQTRAADSLRVG